MNYLNQIGLFLNFMGALFIALSIGPNKDKEEGYHIDEKGKRTDIAYVNKPKLLKVGLFFIIVGFFLQFLSGF